MALRSVAVAPLRNRLSPLRARPRPGGGRRAGALAVRAAAAAPQGGDRKPSPKGVLKQLSSLPLAIAELLSVAGLSVAGTVVVQGESLQYYVDEFPDTWQVLLALGVDHIYSTPYYLGLLGLLGASLFACSVTNQLPRYRAADRWSYRETPAAVERLPESGRVANAAGEGFSSVLIERGYDVNTTADCLYASRGLVGRLAPIWVHVSLLLTLFGTAYSAVGGLHGFASIPEGADFVVNERLRPTSFVSRMPEAAAARVVLNDFTIEYYPNGDVSQYYSDLSVLDTRGNELQRKTIYVNEPIRFGGVTAYQTDWGIASAIVRLAPVGTDIQSDGQALQLPLAAIDNLGGAKAWGGFIPIGEAPAGGGKPKGIVMYARDFQQVIIYGSDGQFVGVRRPGSGRPIEVDGQQLVIEDLVGSSGLELKSDPGVPWVYAGYFGLMVTTALAFIPHEEVWALRDEEEGVMYVGGRANKAKTEFKKEMRAIFELLNEKALAAAAVQQAKAPAGTAAER